MNIILVGFRSSEKCKIGEDLAFKLQHKFIDTETTISTQYLNMNLLKLSATEIYQLCGEPYFRELERQVISEIVVTENTVIATGDGGSLNPDNVQKFKAHGIIIYLSLSLELLVSRYLFEAYHSCFSTQADPLHSILDVYKKRREIFETVSDFTIDAGNKTTDLITDEIIMAISQ